MTEVRTYIASRQAHNSADVFYCCPSGWRIPGIPTVLKGVSYVEYMFASYFRITHIGQRPFTMFFNIPSFEVKELFTVWLQEQKMSLTSRPLLLDQHCLLSTNIGMLVKSLSYYEWSAGLNVCSNSVPKSEH